MAGAALEPLVAGGETGAGDAAAAGAEGAGFGAFDGAVAQAASRSDGMTSVLRMSRANGLFRRSLPIDERTRHSGPGGSRAWPRGPSLRSRARAGACSR